MTHAAARLRRLAASVASPALLRDSLLAGLGTAASRAFLFLLGVLVSRSVGDPESFGRFSSVLLAVQLVATFTGLGLAQTAAQAIAAARDDRPRQDRTVRSTLALVAGASGVVCLALLGAAALRPTGDVAALVPPELLLPATALLFAQLAAAGIEGVLRGLQMFRTLCLSGCMAALAGLAVALPLVQAYGVRGGVLAAAGFLALQGALMAAALGGRLRGGLLAARETLRLLGVTAAPTFLNGLAWNVGMLVPPLLLLRAASGLTELALWNAAGQIRTLVSFAAVVVANAAIPRLAAAHGGRAWRFEVRAALATAMGVALAAYVPVVAAARPLMALYGPQYAAHGGLLVLVASFVLLQVLGSALFVVLLASGRTWQTAALNATWAAVMLAIAPGIVSAGGAAGLAAAYLWTYGPVLGVLVLIVLRTLREPGAARAVAAPAAGYQIQGR